MAITLFVKKGSSLTQSSQSPQSGKSETSRTSRTSREENNCRVYYADLWGKKKEKLAALDAATMESVKWQEVQPTEPMLFFAPRDTAVGDGTPTLPTRSTRLNNHPSPEDIFDYIYGVLHSPAYRTKFKEFLKVDFPRIPYPKDAAEFLRFRDAGRELRMTHLMNGLVIGQ